MSYINDVFGSDGLLSKKFSGYEPRPGQVQLASAVDTAMAEGRVLLGEGPCGTGKSVAYLVPAIYHATHTGRRVIVATANIALQEQIFAKDLPQLRELLPWPFEFASLKGKNNYLCREKHASFEAEFDDHPHTREVLEWAVSTPSGDKSSLPMEPDKKLWAKLSVSANDCIGKDCSKRSECFYEAYKKRAHESQIIITNYHLLFRHLSLRQELGKDVVLPEFGHVICDEAHEAADIAREFNGHSIAESGIYGTIKLVNHFAQRSANELEREREELFGALRGMLEAEQLKKKGRKSKKLRLRTAVDYSGIMNALEGAAEALSTVREGNLDEKDRGRLMRGKLRVANLMESIPGALDLREGFVSWIELNSEEKIAIECRPLDVSDFIANELIGKAKSVSFVSATMTTNNNFDFLAGELGVERPMTVVANSPFNFRRQALLVTPSNMPDPKDPGFEDALTDAFRQVIEMCDGRTLGLFTSYERLNFVADRIADCGHTVLRQRDLPRGELTRRFKEDQHSVLLGTDSFWTGIDVPGEALIAVVIDKLPFPSPDDPIVEAICEKLKNRFLQYHVPRAIMALRQGAGRLIRHKSDYGVIVILDPRVTTAWYGSMFIKSLESMPRRDDLAKIAKFLEWARNRA